MKARLLADQGMRQLLKIDLDRQNDLDRHWKSLHLKVGQGGARGAHTNLLISFN